MKVLMINGSPRPDGCVGRAMKEMEAVFAAEGIETVTLCIGNKDVRGCLACGKDVIVFDHGIWQADGCSCGRTAARRSEQ